MSIREFYLNIGENFDDVLARFGSEQMIAKFVSAYANDGTFDSLSRALENNDVKSAFIYAHTLKGVAANLGFSNLAKVASDITEILRKGSLDGVSELFDHAKRLQNSIIATLSEM